jgi:hypothetical protein
VGRSSRPIRRGCLGDRLAWVDPHLRYQLAARALGPDGHLAFWSAEHVFPSNGDPFFDEIQQVYDAIGEGLPGDAPHPAPGELPEQTKEIEASDLLIVVDVEHLDRTVDYDAEAYLDLLRTFSATSPWRPKAATLSSPRSADAWRYAEPAWCGADGGQSFTSPRSDRDRRDGKPSDSVRISMSGRQLRAPHDGRPAERSRSWALRDARYTPVGRREPRDCGVADVDPDKRCRAPHDQRSATSA